MFRSKGLVPVAVFANRVEPGLVEETHEALRGIPDVVVGALPDDPELSSPTFQQQVEAVAARSQRAPRSRSSAKAVGS